MRRDLLLIPLAATAVGCTSTQEASRPNFIIVLADDMGYGDVSYLDPNSKISTPNLDKLASESAVFTDAHTSSAVSTPTRYGLMTGRYNWRSALKYHVLDGFGKPLIIPGRETVASMLKRADYTTAAIGKWHLGWNWNNIENGKNNIDYSKPIENGPTTVGFDYYFGHSGSLDMPPYVYVENDIPQGIPTIPTVMSRTDSKYGWWRDGMRTESFIHEEVTPELFRRANKYITEKANGDDPFFLYLPLPAPHTPILPSKEYQGRSGVSDYADFVMMIDDLMGELLATVENQGISGETVIIFTTDNGCSPAAGIDEMIEQGHYPNSIYRGHKADLFDGGHRVPFFVKWDGVIKPHHVDQTVCLTDIYATFANFAGVELCDSEAEDSYDISSLMLSTKELSPIREATVHHSQNGSFSIRKGEWKLLISPSSGGWSYPRPGTDDKVIATLPPVQLFNMESDPSETTNLYAEYPEIVDELRSLMISYIENGRSTPGEPQKNEGNYPWKQLNWMNE